MNSPPEQDRPGSDNRIVVGFNGSPASWNALRWAADEAGQRRATLEIVACLDPRPTPPDRCANSDLRSLGDLIDEASRVARSRGLRVPVRAALEDGTVGAALVRRSRGALMLVIGHRDPRSTTTIGTSLSSFCLTHADCAVTVVTSTERPTHLDANRQLARSDR